MQQQDIYKTFSVIKQLIELDDAPAIASLAAKVKQQDTEGQFVYIVQALESQRFEDATLLIVDFERQTTQMVPHFDPILSALKVELLLNETELNALTAEVTDLLKTIDTFTIKYHHHLGATLERLLYLRKEKLRLQASTNPLLQKQYEAALSEYEEFAEMRQSPIVGVLHNLNETEMTELKMLYRKASLICHPDRVAEEMKEAAQEMFAELHEAYCQNDLRKLRIMTDLLESTGRFEPMRDKLDTAAALRSQIAHVLFQKEERQSEMAEVLASQSYHTISNITESWEDYFTRISENFHAQVSELENWHAHFIHQN